MTVKVGINGFGRIGRNFYRAAKEQGAITHEAYRRYLGLADDEARLALADRLDPAKSAAMFYTGGQGGHGHQADGVDRVLRAIGQN